MMKTLQKLIILIAIFVSLGLVQNAFAIDWTSPTATPPSGNTEAPINVGSASQSKSGILKVLGALGVGGANTLIDPSLKFEVSGKALMQELGIFGPLVIGGTANNPGMGKVLTSNAQGWATWQTPKFSISELDLFEQNLGYKQSYYEFTTSKAYSFCAKNRDGGYIVTRLTDGKWKMYVPAPDYPTTYAGMYCFN